MLKKLTIALVLAGSVAHADCPQFKATYYCVDSDQSADEELRLVSTSYTPDLSYYEVFEDEEFSSVISDGIEHYANDATRAAVTCVSSTELSLHLFNTEIDERSEFKYSKVSEDELLITGVYDDGTQREINCRKISDLPQAAKKGPGKPFLFRRGALGTATGGSPKSR
jgi:hypothetical protein